MIGKIMKLKVGNFYKHLRTKNIYILAQTKGPKSQPEATNNTLDNEEFALICLYDGNRWGNASNKIEDVFIGRFNDFTETTLEWTIKNNN